MDSLGLEAIASEIKGRPFRKEMRRNLFIQRVVNLWNSLPQKAVEAKSVDIFKAGIDRLLISMGVRGYGEKAGEWG